MTIINGSNKSDVISGVDTNPFDSYTIHGLQGNDTIIGGFLSDTLYGDQGNDIILGLFGSDTLYGGEGNDILFGAVNEFTLNPVAVPFVIVDPDTLYGGNGDDILVGVAGSFTLSPTVDNLSTSAVSGGNALYGENGNDALYGVAITVSVFDENVVGRTVFNTYLGNTLDGGSGNDYLVGTAAFSQITLINYQGTVEEFFGKDILHGGTGDDTLIGDFGTVVFNIVTNPTLGSIPTVGTDIHHFGSDLLDGGSGNDLLVGDFNTLILNIVNSPGWHQEEHYGNDTLIGGSGNDTLVGDVVSSHVDPGGVEFFGNDIFQFSLGEGQNFGNDVILDLNAGGVADTLKFTDVKDVNGDTMINAHDVEASLVSISANTSGDVVLSFTNGSITASNIDFTGQHSLADLGVHIVAEGALSF